MPGFTLFLRPATMHSPVLGMPRLPALLAGGGIGMVSGLTGMGGGVLLAPLLLHCHWASPRTAAAVAAVFILANSAMALLGHAIVANQFPPDLRWFIVAAVFGGTIGAQLGSRHLSAAVIRRILAATLLMAGIKLVLG
jgi:uncharacterized membrane protein YfcA